MEIREFFESKFGKYVFLSVYSMVFVTVFLVAGLFSVFLSWFLYVFSVVSGLFLGGVLYGFLCWTDVSDVFSIVVESVYGCVISVFSSFHLLPQTIF